MSNEWDDYAEEWDSDASVQEYANRAFKELSAVIELDGLSVFDFGCGTGTLTQLMSPRVKEIVALDGSTEMIKHLAKKGLGNVTTISGFLTEELIETSPHLANRFDLIVASSVCGFLPDYEATLGVLKTLLKDSGLFVQWDWLSSDDGAGPGLTESRVLHALEAHGFSDIQLKRPFEMSSSQGKMTVLMAVGKKA